MSILELINKMLVRFLGLINPSFREWYRDQEDRGFPDFDRYLEEKGIRFDRRKEQKRKQ